MPSMTPREVPAQSRPFVADIRAVREWPGRARCPACCTRRASPKRSGTLTAMSRVALAPPSSAGCSLGVELAWSRSWLERHSVWRVVLGGIFSTRMHSAERDRASIVLQTHLRWRRHSIPPAAASATSQAAKGGCAEPAGQIGVDFYVLSRRRPYGRLVAAYHGRAFPPPCARSLRRRSARSRPALRSRPDSRQLSAAFSRMSVDCSVTASAAVNIQPYLVYRNAATRPGSSLGNARLPLTRWTTAGVSVPPATDLSVHAGVPASCQRRVTEASGRAALKRLRALASDRSAAQLC